MTLDAAKKAHNNPYQVINPKKGEKTSKADNTTVNNPSAVDSYSSGGAPRFMASAAEIIPYGQVGRVKDFDKYGKDLFTNDSHADLQPKALNNLRVQYALRYYAKHHGGLDIGNSGIGGWGGDGILFTKHTTSKCEKAIDFIMQKEGFKSQDHAIAWVMDKTKGEIGLGIAKPYYNPRTGGFDAAEPAWASRPKSKDPSVQMMWDAPIMSQYEDQRKYGDKRALAEKSWEKNVEPLLQANGRMPSYIRTEKQKYMKIAEQYVQAKNHDEEIAGATKMNEFRLKTQEHEKRYAWLQNQWDHEIKPHLKENGVHTDAISAIRDYFMNELGNQYLDAKSDNEIAQFKKTFEEEKQWYTSWTPHRGAQVA